MRYSSGAIYKSRAGRIFFLGKSGGFIILCQFHSWNHQEVSLLMSKIKKYTDIFLSVSPETHLKEKYKTSEVSAQTSF